MPRMDGCSQSMNLMEFQQSYRERGNIPREFGKNEVVSVLSAPVRWGGMGTSVSIVWPWDWFG
ncbi:MAG: hypothetical protein A3H45_09040 [Ignavibacteria bacterium RIFCSPLOWO2_02_FULL_55_14]|nr:MAG: hypothetical protein A3H45_09040 [Ignavibacteria bacterium RIFCSPLOWO2_02_FULL_55_14]